MKLNEAKATGRDKIPSETWEFMNGETRQKMMDLIEKVWETERMPQEWRIKIISSL